MNINVAKGIEESEIFLVILSKHYLDDPDALEQLLYAKSLGKPMIIMKIRVGISIPDVFNNCDIIETITMDSKEEWREKLINLLKKIEENEKRGEKNKNI